MRISWHILNPTDGKSESHEDSSKMYQMSTQGSLKVLRETLGFDVPKGDCDHSVIFHMSYWLPGAIVCSAGPEHVSTVIDIAHPVEQVLHFAIPRHEVF